MLVDGGSRCTAGRADAKESAQTSERVIVGAAIRRFAEKLF